MFEADSIEFSGDKTLAQFKIIEMRLGVVDNGGKAEIIVHFKRIFCFYIYTMFIPSLCVVVTAELTLFVDEVSVTVKTYDYTNTNIGLIV